MSLNCFASQGRRLGCGVHTRMAGAGALLLLLSGCAMSPAKPGHGPNADDRRFERAVTAMQQGPQEDALELLDELAADYPALSGPWVNLGILHAAAGRDEDAETAFLRAIELSPRHAVAHAELGIVLRRQGRFAEADEAYREALALDPGYALAWRNRGVLLDLYLGRPAEALECYERYLALVGGKDADEQVARWVVELRLRTDSRVATR